MEEYGVFFKVQANLHLPDSEIIKKMKVVEKVLNDNIEDHTFTFMDFRKKPSR